MEHVWLKPTVLVIKQFRREITAVLKFERSAAKATPAARQDREAVCSASEIHSPASQLSPSSISKSSAGAPVSNLDAERSMDSINHELNIRGAEELKAASSDHVGAKGPQLALNYGKLMDKKFIKMTKKGGEIPTAIELLRRQKEPKKKGLEDKDIPNISINKQRSVNLSRS